MRAGDEVLGSIWAAMDGPLTPERTATLRDAAKLVALHLLRVRAGADVQRRLRAELVSTALEGGAGARDALGRLGLAGQRVVVIAGGAHRASRAGGRRTPTSCSSPTGSASPTPSPCTSRRFARVRRSPSSATSPTASFRPPAAPLERDGRAREDFLEPRRRRACPRVIAVGSPAARHRLDARTRGPPRIACCASSAAGTTPQQVATMADVQTESLLLELRDLTAARGDEPTRAGRDACSTTTARIDAHLLETLEAWLDSFGDVASAAAATVRAPQHAALPAAAPRRGERPRPRPIPNSGSRRCSSCGC